jgi:hypothetical protein
MRFAACRWQDVHQSADKVLQPDGPAADPGVVGRDLEADNAVDEVRLHGVDKGTDLLGARDGWRVGCDRQQIAG